MENNQEIGVAILHYNEDGSFKTAEFKPTIIVKIDSKMMDELFNIETQKGEDIVKEQANNVFATWFQRMNDIELADREKYKIVTELVAPCERYDSGIISKCSIKFIFKEI